MTEKKKPGRKPELFKVDAAYEEAVEIALRTPPPPPQEKPRRKTKKKPR